MTTIGPAGCVAGLVVPVSRQGVCLEGASLDPRSDGCGDCDAMVLERFVIEVLSELNNPSSGGGYEIGKTGGSRGQGWALSHPTIGHDAPLGQRGDLGCHLSQLVTPQFLPFAQLGARGWR